MTLFQPGTCRQNRYPSIALWIILPMMASLLAIAGGCSQEQAEHEGEGDTPPTQEIAITEAQPNASAWEKFQHNKDQLDQKYWAQELKAQKYERAFIVLWDAIRKSKDKLAALREISFSELRLGKATQVQHFEFDISKHSYAEGGQVIKGEDWPAYLEQMASEGFKLVQCEFHHQNFWEDDNGRPMSAFSSEFHVSNRSLKMRYILKGNLLVQWSDETDDKGNPLPAVIDASDFYRMERAGRQPYQTYYLPGALSALVSENSPMLVYDLNGDGLSDLMLPNINKKLINSGNFDFDVQSVSPNMPDKMMSGILADFTGDGYPDLLVGGGFQGEKKYIARDVVLTERTPIPMLVLYEGSKGGNFAEIGRAVFRSDLGLERPTSLTAGDVDGDGDLDLWVSQYKQPYREGQLPTPYYDANDGYPSFLLLNDGTGHMFTDATEAAGLAAKRYRRTYGNSLADMDEDGDLDLLVISDFSGVDLYFNDGKGNFSDVTTERLYNRHLFGMSHTFADFNLDGLMDFYVLGMSSTTARRLDAMGLGNPNFQDRNEMRDDMGYGNRMYVADASAHFKQPAFEAQVARSGWSWGCTDLDFDNDGDRDIYITNGHVSRESAVDYCTHFWRDDIYRLDSKEDEDLATVYSKVFDLENRHGYSWNGFEKNHFFVNQAGQGFFNASFLLGGAIVDDSRGVISDDFNGDGLVDLLMITYRYPDDHRIFFLRNEMETRNNWIGIRLQDSPVYGSPMGARIKVHTADGVMPAVISSGDSFLSQHPPVKHFGLGQVGEVEKIEVFWINGMKAVVNNPAVNKYHLIEPDLPG